MLTRKPRDFKEFLIMARSVAACFAELAMIEILIPFERHVVAKGFRILVKTLGAREYPKGRQVNSNLWPFQKSVIVSYLEDEPGH